MIDNVNLIYSDINASNVKVIVDTSQGQNESRSSQIKSLLRGSLKYLISGCRHNFLKTSIYDIFFLSAL